MQCRFLAPDQPLLHAVITVTAVTAVTLHYNGIHEEAQNALPRCSAFGFQTPPFSKTAPFRSQFLARFSRIGRFERERSGRFVALTSCFLVAPTGFEPATSALRGRRPKPLDDGATYVRRCIEMAGVGGVEPPHTAPETAVLPLDDTPSTSRRCAFRKRKRKREWIYYASSRH